jgi:hypothetical protein
MFKKVPHVGVILGALAGSFSGWRLLMKRKLQEVPTLENWFTNHALQLAGRHR